jgi:predicted RNase H-like nuclease (RuvC/YqgF family)
MIDAVMFAALGFLVASLLALMLAPPLWHRAVRLTTRRLEATMPMSVTDIQADKDQLRAEYAIELRRVEVALEKAKDKAARELVQANKRRVEISVLNQELGAAKGQLQENENANRVLEQTIKRRLPDLDARIKAAKEAIAELESANAELRNTVASQAEALKEARSAVQNQRGDIEGLRTALEGGGSPLRRLAKSDSELAKENQRLSADLSRLKEELERQKMSSEEDALLRRELDKLAQQILAVAQTQPLPEPEEPVASFIPQQPEPLPQEPEPVPHGANGGGNGIEAPEQYESAAEIEQEPEPMVEDVQAAEEEAEPRGPLIQRFATRRARRRAAAAAAKGRGQSLSERLKDVPADAPEN